MLADLKMHAGINSISKLATIAALLAVTACGESKPGGQTVAVVDGQPVTQMELRSEVSSVPAKNRASVERQALQTIINRKVLVEAAKDQGLEKDPRFQLELEKQKEALLSRMFLEKATADITGNISAADVATFLSQHPQIGPRRQILDIQQVGFTLPTGKAALADIKATKTMPDLLLVLQKHGIAAQQKVSKADTAALPLEVYDALQKTRGGEPLVIVNGPQAIGQIVASATDAPLPSNQAETLARTTIANIRGKERVKQQIDALRGAAKIQYGEGYGPPAKSNAT